MASKRQQALVGRSGKLKTVKVKPYTVKEHKRSQGRLPGRDKKGRFKSR